MEKTETIMVNFASMEALNEYGTVKEIGHTIMAKQ
jgi:hypothetical protein